VRSPWSLLPKSGWKRWLAVGLVAVAALFLLLVALVVAAILAFRSPKFQSWFMEKMIERQTASYPEDATSAPAPVPAYRGVEPDARTARNASDIFCTTNIWTAHLRLSEERWRALGPNRVAPIQNFIQADGSPLLRNTNAARAGIAGVLGFDFPWSSGDLEFGGINFTNVGVRIKGNGTFLGSLRSYKHPFKVDLNRTVKGQKLVGRNTLNFGNLTATASCLGDALGYEFYREAGVPAPRTAFARVFLTIQGRENHRLLGLYVLPENPDSAWAQERFGERDVALFKPVTYELFRDLGENWSAYADIYDAKIRLKPAQQQRMMAIASFATHASDAEFAARLDEHFDLDETARYFACEVLLANYDGILSNGQNFLIYLDPREDRVGFIPWDLDHSWGEFPHLGTADQREHASIWHPWVGQKRFLERLFAAEPFRQRYRQDLERLLTTQFVPTRLGHRVDELAALIRPAIAETSTNRLRRFDLAVSDHFTDGPRDGRPEDPYGPVFQLKRFFVNRAASVREQLDGKNAGVIITRDR
jgi:spore coat protein H